MCVTEGDWKLGSNQLNPFPCDARAEGFEWQSDEFLHVTGCLGTDVTLGWAYVTSPGETIETVFWSQGHDTIASLYQ